MLLDASLLVVPLLGDVGVVVVVAHRDDSRPYRELFLPTLLCGALRLCDSLPILS